MGRALGLLRRGRADDRHKSILTEDAQELAARDERTGQCHASMVPVRAGGTSAYQNVSSAARHVTHHSGQMTAAHDEDGGYPDIRSAVGEICARFGDPYWRAIDRA